MKDKMHLNSNKWNAMKDRRVKKHEPKQDHRFAPKIIGNERAALLSDEEMQGMHKFKKSHGLDAKTPVTYPAPHATMLLKSRD